MTIDKTGIADRLTGHDHVLRKLDDALDFSIVPEELHEYCPYVITPGIDPGFIARYMLIIYLYDLERPTPAYRHFRKRIDDDMQGNGPYRWFLKTGFDSEMPQYKEVMQVRESLGGKSKWDSILKMLLHQCAENGLPHTQGSAQGYY